MDDIQMTINWNDPEVLADLRSVLGCGKEIQAPFKHVLAAFHSADCTPCLVLLSKAVERRAIRAAVEAMPAPFIDGKTLSQAALLAALLPKETP